MAYRHILTEMAEMDDITACDSLNYLCRYLKHAYGKKVIILLDEYDTPMQEAYVYGYWEEMTSFLRNLFHATFKTNACMERAVMTGITRVSNYNGFVKALFQGDVEAMNYYMNKISMATFSYFDVGSTSESDTEPERLHALLQGKSVIARIDQNVVYRSLAEDPANIYSLLLVAGYLKTQKKELQADGSYLCEVSIPNREIAVVYKSEVLSHLLQIGAVSRTTANLIAESRKQLQSI